MSSSNSYMPNSLLPFPNSVPLTHVPPSAPSPLDGDEPLDPAEISGFYDFLDDFYVPQDPTAVTTLAPSLEAPPQGWTPIKTEPTRSADRPRERLLAPRRTGQESEEIGPAPKKRKGAPRKGTTGHTIEKVDHACARCRRQKQKCDGIKPHCQRCTRKGQRCSYILGKRQFAAAQKEGAGNFHTFVVEQPGPVGIAQAENGLSAAPGRSLLAYQGAPGAGVGGFAAGADGNLQDLEEFKWEFEVPYPGAPGAGVGSFAAAGDGQRQYPEDFDWDFGGLSAGLSGVPQHPQGSDPSHMSNTRLDNALRYPQQPHSTVRLLSSEPNPVLQQYKEPGFNDEYHPPPSNEPSPYLEEQVVDDGGFYTQHDGLQQYYTIDPNMAFAGAVPHQQYSYLPQQDWLGMGFTSFNNPLPSPYNAQNPLGSGFF